MHKSTVLLPVVVLMLWSAPALAEDFASFSATPGPGKNYAFRESATATQPTQYQELSFSLYTSN